jgi:hypothetical protein
MYRYELPERPRRPAFIVPSVEGSTTVIGFSGQELVVLCPSHADEDEAATIEVCSYVSDAISRSSLLSSANNPRDQSKPLEVVSLGAGLSRKADDLLWPSVSNFIQKTPKGMAHNEIQRRRA